MSHHFRQIPEVSKYPAAQVPDATRLGPVDMAVTDRAKALAVWRDLVGLTVLSEDAEAVTLGAGGTPLIVLHPGAARPVMPRTSGLYHVAIHVPTRRDLARAVARLYAAKYRNAPTDHLVTETTYLWDADGNGIELTFETPDRGTMVAGPNDFYGIDRDGRRHSGRGPVDLGSLFGELEEGESVSEPLPAGTRIGHVHLHVGSLDDAMRFYSDVIGFEGQMLGRGFGMGDVTLSYPPHIVAFNTWNGEGAPQPPPGHAGLRNFTIELPAAADRDAAVERLRAAGSPVEMANASVLTADPAGNRIRLTVQD